MRYLPGWFPRCPARRKRGGVGRIRDVRLIGRAERGAALFSCSIADSSHRLETKVLSVGRLRSRTMAMFLRNSPCLMLRTSVVELQDLYAIAFVTERRR